uniref:Protein angel homolog 1 n=1 Tax=Danio rerio TaxID=7955 RepID=E7F7F7_DANRE|nr:protein angel homolog 1 isoform X1 [Danio rerio]|eukprot:XP_698034.2 protein angel homolog 1 isoform X1 [Danio rerio]
MIVSAMFYALYPLSRLLDRVSAAWQKPPPVHVNGREVWDGGGQQQQQTEDSLQRNSTERSAQLPQDKHTHTHLPQGTLVETLERARAEEELQKTLCDVSQMEGVLSETPLAGLEDTHNPQPVKNQAESDYVFSSVAGKHSEISPHLTADAPSEADRCDGVSASSGGAALLLASRSPVFDLSALLSDTQQLQMDAEPIGWHFPVGHGLAEMCYCPYVQFPDVSYYPAFQDQDNIEVMWRVWEDLSEPQSSDSADASPVFDFSVMSYNILAQDLLEANPHLYTHCAEDALRWENRLQAVLKELQIWQPDIVCLQEVQEDHFQEQMHPVLINMGYTCIYKRRTGSKTDGCAVLYRGERFTQLSVSLLEFRRSECELLDRDNVGIVLLLQPTAGPHHQFTPVCVANTHLLFNPRRGDVKLAQLAIMFAEIHSVMQKCRSEGKSCELILCGDFNAVPRSPLWTLITTGELYYHGLPTWMVSGQTDLSYKAHHNRLFSPLWPSSLGITDRCQYNTDTHTTASDGKQQYSHEFMCQLRFCEAACVRPADLELIPGVTDKTPDLRDMFSLRFSPSLRHRLSLTSAYSHIHPETLTDLVTTLNSEGAAMVDYIFYSQRQKSGFNGGGESAGGLKLLARLSLLSEAHLWSLRGLPDESFPSDHLSLLVKLQLSSADI